MSIRAQLSEALPSLSFSVLGGLLWAGLMALSALVSMYLRHWENHAHFETIILVFCLGGFFAFAPAMLAYNVIARGKTRSQRFAAAYIALLFVTLGATAFVYYIQFRDYFAQWHEAALSRIWFLQTFYTGLGAAYEFAVLGSRFYLPIGLIALFGASFWLSKKPV